MPTRICSETQGSEGFSGSCPRRCDQWSTLNRVLKTQIQAVQKALDARRAWIVAVSVKRDLEIQTSTNTNHEHEIQQPGKAQQAMREKGTDHENHVFE